MKNANTDSYFIAMHYCTGNRTEAPRTHSDHDQTQLYLLRSNKDHGMLVEFYISVFFLQ